MTRSKGVGRGRAPGSRRALEQANAERRRQAQPEPARPAPEHLRPFQTEEHMAELRRRKAARRPEAVAARRAQEKARHERQ